MITCKRTRVGKGVLLAFLVIAQLVSTVALAAGNWAATWVTGSQTFHIGTYYTKQEAVAALQAWSPPAGTAASTQESVASITSNEVTYLYTAPQVAYYVGPYTYGGCINPTTGINCTVEAGEPAEQPSESAVLAEIVAQYQANPTLCASTVTTSATSGWENASGAPEGPYDNYGVQYFSVTAKYSSGGCTQTWSGGFSIAGWRNTSCPEGYVPNPPICLVDGQGNVLGPNNTCAYSGPPTTVGDPCDVATGDFEEAEQDFAAAGLSMTRRYHSVTLEFGHALGTGWTHNYAASLVLSGSVPLGLVRPDGHQDPVATVGGAYVSLSGDGIQVQSSGSNWIASLTDGSKEVYNSGGQLTQLISPGGQTTNLSYGTAGQLSTVTGPFGHTLQFAYDSSGRISTVTEPDGVSKIVYAYDSNNNLVSATYPDNSIRQYQYQSATFVNNLTGIVDESTNQFVTAGYDPTTAAVTSSQQAGGAQAVSIVYGTSTATVTDSLGATHTYTFTSGTGYSPRVTTLTYNSLSQSFSVPSPSVDPQQRVTQSTDANGNVTTYAYDNNHMTSKTEAYGTSLARTTSYQYLTTTSALPTLITEPLKTTTLSYFSGTNLVQTKTTTDPATGVSRSWNYTYDSYGRVLTAKGPRTDVNSTTTYAYYTCTTGSQCGQVHTVTDAVGNVTTYNTYNAFGQPLTVTDANNVVTTLTYDSRQRLTSRQVGTETTGFAYYPTGLLKQVTLPDNSYAAYSYDNAHRLTQIKDAFGNSLQYSLDAMGNRLAEKSYDPNGVLHRTRSRTINALNEVYQEISAAGTAAVTTTYGYDNDGNMLTVAAPMARNTSNVYDALSRLMQQTDPGGGISHVTYDANDNVLSVKDPRSLTTTYTNNGLGDRTGQSSPDTGATGYAYDSGGNIQSVTTARGATTSYAYDALNRVTQVSYATAGTTDQTISIAYDSGTNGKGHLTSAADANQSLSYTYDGLGRVASKKQTVGAVALTVAYAYTNAVLTTLTTPSGKTIAYAYNANHQVSGVSVNGIPVLSGVTYEPMGSINGWTWGNGTTTSRSYNTDGKISNISSAATKDYSYDNALRIIGIADGSNSNLSWSYGYDTLDRVASANSPLQSASLTYDSNGNRLTQGGSSAETLGISSTSNILGSVSGGLSRTYSYDASGNTLGYAGNTFTYNDAGRISSASNGSGTTAYLYNALGQRIRKSSASTTVHFVYDESGHLLGEYDGTGTLIQEIVWVGDTPVATVRIEACGLSIFYIHTDHLNTPRRITRRSTADVVWSWESDPFGAALPNQNPSGLGTFSFNLRSPGQYYDGETALSYNYYRDYDASVGRYVESDPVGLGGGSYSTYAYALGNPLGFADPSGLCVDRTRCEQLRRKMDNRDRDLADKLAKYDRVSDAIGGSPYFGGLRFTKPGSHYDKIQELQRGQAKDFAEYQSLRCDEDDDQGPGFGAITNDMLDRATQNVPPPDWASVPAAPSIPSSNQTSTVAAWLAVIAAAAVAAAYLAQ